MATQIFDDQLARPRTLLRDLTASLVGLALGVAVITTLEAQLTTDVAPPASLPTAATALETAALEAVATLERRNVSLEELNALYAAALARLTGGVDRSVLPPVELNTLADSLRDSVADRA